MPLRKYKVLIIDDEADLTNMTKLQLEMSGYEVAAAYCGSDGIATARAFMPDIILLDIRMPDLNGFEVLTELKRHEDTSSIPVVMFTTCSQKEDKEKAFLLGAAEYVKKPVNLYNLGTQLSGILQNKKI